MIYGGELLCMLFALVVCDACWKYGMMMLSTFYSIVYRANMTHIYQDVCHVGSVRGQMMGNEMMGRFETVGDAEDGEEDGGTSR